MLLIACRETSDYSTGTQLDCGIACSGTADNGHVLCCILGRVSAMVSYMNIDCIVQAGCQLFVWVVLHHVIDLQQDVLHYVEHQSSLLPVLAVPAV